MQKHVISMWDEEGLFFRFTLLSPQKEKGK